MANDDFDLRLDRLRRAGEVLKEFPKGLHGDALRYLFGQTEVVPHLGSDDSAPAGSSNDKADADAEAAALAGATKTAKESQKSGSRRSKPAAVARDKNVNLAPEGKESFKDFASAKAPQTVTEKYTVCVFWLTEIAEQPVATIGQVVSCFHLMDWKLPSDVRNAASQAGRVYLDSSNLEDLKVATVGLNLVKHDLPRAKK